MNNHFCSQVFFFMLHVFNPGLIARPRWIAAIVLALTSAIAIPNLASEDRPNVIIFFIDDLGYKDLGCYGADFYETPRLDQLARQSARFTDFYSAHPVCSPTRAALMTGKAPQRVGITQWISQPSHIHLPLAELTIAETFAAAGYETGYIGKWHLGEKDSQLPTAHGFSWMKSVNRAGQPASYFFPFAGRQRDGVGYWDVPDLDQAKEDDYLTDKITDHAISFISQNRDRPFFLCLAHYAVHTPIQSPPALVKEYQEKRAGRPDASSKEPAVKEKFGALSRPRQDDAKYAAMVENLDSNVGRVLDRLEEFALAKNTIVVFTSDNGGLTTLRNRVGPTSVRPYRAGKGWVYEGGIRIPTMIRWPGKISPANVGTPGITMDFFPTLLELAGLDSKPGQHLDGHSLVSALNGRPDKRLDSRFVAWHYPHRHGSGHRPASAIRRGQWKLIHWLEDGQNELYDLSNDEGEQRDLSKQFPGVAEQLSSTLSDWVRETTPR